MALKCYCIQRTSFESRLVWKMSVAWESDDEMWLRIGLCWKVELPLFVQ